MEKKEIKKIQKNGLTKLNEESLNQVNGGKIKEKYVSAFYCEYCKQTIHLNGVYSLERAKKEHNAQYHPTIRN